METAKQHNDKLTGEILPIVVDSKFNFKPKLHPMTCGKCGSVINTGLCAKCQLDCQSCLVEHDRELKEAVEMLLRYAMISEVTAVIYPEGTHKEWIAKARSILERKGD